MHHYIFFLREVLRFAGQLYFERAEAELWKFAEPFYAWLYDLFAHPYAGWQDSLDSFLAEQEAEGRTISPEARKSVEDYIESYFVGTQYDSEVYPYLGGGGRHPSNPNLFYSLPPGTGFTDEDLSLAHDIALATSQLRRAIDSATQSLEKPSFLERINPLRDSAINQRYEIAEMRAALSELELLYTLLGYDRITWSRFTHSEDSGLAGAELHVPNAGPEHGIQPETIETLLAAWGAASLASLAGKLASRGVARLGKRAASRALKSVDETVDDILIDTYSNLSKARHLSGQTHHLNQTAAYRSIVARDKGMAIKLEGNILQDATAPHTLAHQSLESFWNAYRGGELVPTNLAYTRALKESLRAAGLSEQQVAQAIRAAIRERVEYNLLGGMPVPEVPGAIRNLAK